MPDGEAWPPPKAGRAGSPAGAGVVRNGSPLPLSPSSRRPSPSSARSGVNRGVRAAVTASSAGDRSAAPHSPVLNTPAMEPAGAGLAVAKPDAENADI